MTLSKKDKRRIKIAVGIAIILLLIWWFCGFGGSKPWLVNLNTQLGNYSCPGQCWVNNTTGGGNSGGGGSPPVYTCSMYTSGGEFPATTCGGTCPGGYTCSFVTGPSIGCTCQPTHIAPGCSWSGGITAAPTCGGSCSNGESCTTFAIGDLEYCGCRSDTSSYVPIPNNI